MAVITMSQASEALKIHYLPAIRSQISEKMTAFFAEVTKGSEDIVGSEARFEMKYGRHGGMSATTETGTFPTPNPRKYKQAVVSTKNLFATLQISQKAIDASQNDKGAFENLLNNQIEALLKDAKENEARQLHGDGSGLFSTIGTAGSTTSTIPVSNIDFFSAGMLIDIMSASANDTVKYADCEVVDVNYDAGTIRLAADPGDTVSGDKICIQDSYGNELTGLGKVFSTDTLYGIDRSLNSWAVPIMVNQAGALDEIDMLTVLDKIDTRTGGEPNMFICTKGVKRAYYALQQAYKRNPEYMNLNGGFRAMKFNDLPLVDDKYCRAGGLYFLSMADWKMHQMADWNWLDKHGSIFSMVSRSAIWEATLYSFCDIATYRPGGNGLLYGITEE